MGVDEKTGTIVDLHHPLSGTSIADCILAIPCGRGSCSASGAIVELLLNRCAPAALIFHRLEKILTLGVLIANEVFGSSIPVVLVDDTSAWEALSQAESANITQNTLEMTLKSGDKLHLNLQSIGKDGVELSHADVEMIHGKHGDAARIAMEMIISFAAMQGARSLTNVSQVHIDACVYVGKSSLLIPEKLHSLGAKLAVPTTCNSLSADQQRWRELGADPEISIAASKIGDLYMAMGAQQSFTCAPYLLDTQPKAGEQVGWAESNAVVFANSVLGARTQKYPDYLDVFIGITGRAPFAGCHLDTGRVPSVYIEVPRVDQYDDTFFPLLGYHIGDIVGSRIPLIYGIENTNPSIADLKGFGAGFATSSSSPMFHISGVTPEAKIHETISTQLEKIIIKPQDLLYTWKRLNSATSGSVDLIALGNPHFSVQEFERLASLCAGQTKSSKVSFMVTTGRDVYQKALKAGFLDELERFGARIVTDTCWCMIAEPVIPPAAATIVTNSSKYAHYGPGIVKKVFYFAPLELCVRAACSGEMPADKRQPFSLSPDELFEYKTQLQLCV
jgi:predicted aconitase/predicted aconitase with swiveling domain